MPELPEVETVVRYLRTKVIDQKIKNINLIYSGVLKNSNESQFIKYLQNEKFLDVTRKGKFIIFHLSNNKCFVVHLRMEGKLFVQPLDSQPNFKQLICEFTLEKEILRFYDTRKFGTFEIIDEDKFQDLKSVSKLAMDANTDLFTPEYLFNITRKSKIAIKTFLLDQSNVAGIGNIYVNEILFDSKILPTRPTNEVTYDECVEIVKFSKKILNKSIENNGTTIHTYKFSEYESGGYQEFLHVHGLKNKSCKCCGNNIIFAKVNGRGTFYCRNCQK